MVYILKLLIERYIFVLHNIYGGLDEMFRAIGNCTEFNNTFIRNTDKRLDSFFTY